MIKFVDELKIGDLVITTDNKEFIVSKIERGTSPSSIIITSVDGRVIKTFDYSTISIK